MIRVQIIREASTPDGTFGRLYAEYTDGRFECDTLELPWRDNIRNFSCIPLGEYPVEWSHSKKFGSCYRVLSVPDRSGILIHKGNYAGDVHKKKRTSVQGCILLGMQRGILESQNVVLNSGHAIAAFEEFMQERAFRLTITAQQPMRAKEWA